MRNNQWADYEIAQFSHHLSQLLSAGIPLMEALSFLQGISSKKGGRAYSLLIEHLKGGAPLSEALKRVRYPPFFCFLLVASEHHGQLPEALKQASEFYQKRHQRKRKLKKAAAYPTLILLSSFLTFWMILSLLLPQLSSLYFTLEVELPAFTKMMLSVGEHWAQVQLLLIVSLLLIVVVLFWFYHRHRPAWEHQLLKIPILSSYLRLHLNSMISIQAGALLESGVTIMQACQLFVMEGHWFMVQSAFKDIHSQLQQGMPLSKAVSQGKLFLPILPQMLHIAEQSGTVGPTLQRLGWQLEEELDQYVERASGILESVVTLGSGSLVFLIMMTLFVPLFQLISQF